MSRMFFLFPIGLLFGFAAGFVVAGSLGVSFDGHDHGAGHGAPEAVHSADHQDYAHTDTVEAADPLNPPTVALDLLPDPVSGWSLRLTTTNFRFDPENAGGARDPGYGHAHLYVDGIKVARLYGPWHHLDGLSPGSHEIRVTLNGNDHRALAVDGAPIEARATLVAP